MRSRSRLTGSGKLVMAAILMAVCGAGIGWCVQVLWAIEYSRQSSEKRREREEQSYNMAVIEEKEIQEISDPVSMAWPAAREALTLLRMHESLNGKLMIGDRGRARGWLQQHEQHWYEGCEMIGVDWPWPEDTNDLSKCESVAVGYWMRHARKYLDEGDVEELIRRFRLPYHPYRDDNNEYLLKVLEKGL